ncbi:MAG: MFS transporter, partial [Candidatus Heimdallarchaeota archaeon]|nr:MFS transporter [Candidatus Heimdallarchaeota archaeon]MCK5050001.1 MFS transporter [Candidatus Heimdallarchaeota archaeon]
MAIFSPFLGYFSRNAHVGAYFVSLGVVFFAVSTYLIASSNTFFDLIIGNFILGLGAATYHPIGLGMISNSFSEEKKGKALAINHIFGVAGTAISPISTLWLSIMILDDWRITFRWISYISLSLAIIMFFWQIKSRMVHRYIEEIESNIKVFSAENGFTSTNSLKDKEYRKWLIVTLALLLFISAFRGGVYRCFSYFTVTLLKDYYDLSSIDAGLWTSMVLLIGTTTDFGGAAVSDNYGTFGRMKIVIASAVATALAIVNVIVITLYFNTMGTIIFAFILFSVSFYLAGGTLQALMSEFVPPKYRTFFYSIVFSLGLVVSSLSPTIFGWLLDLTNSPVGGFLFLLGLILTSLLFTIILWRRLKNVKRH